MEISLGIPDEASRAGRDCAGEQTDPGGRPRAVGARSARTAADSVYCGAFAGSSRGGWWRRLLATVLQHFWFKCFGSVFFIGVFFAAYVFLLRNPVHPVHVMPVTLPDRWIHFSPVALPVYLSLWAYISLPAMLAETREEIVRYGVWMAAICISGLTVFYFWPTAIPPENIRWERYPGMAFLKGADAAGNAFPSLHVATAVFAAIRLNAVLRKIGCSIRVRGISVLWAAGIVLSTLATKQHLAIDVAGGIVLALGFAFLSRRMPEGCGGGDRGRYCG